MGVLRLSESLLLLDLAVGEPITWLWLWREKKEEGCDRVDKLPVVGTRGVTFLNRN